MTSPERSSKRTWSNALTPGKLLQIFSMETIVSFILSHLSFFIIHCLTFIYDSIIPIFSFTNKGGFFLIRGTFLCIFIELQKRDAELFVIYTRIIFIIVFI